MTGRSGTLRLPALMVMVSPAGAFTSFCMGRKFTPRGNRLGIQGRIAKMEVHLDNHMDVAIQPTFTVPANVRLRAEARKSRRRFYPSTILYTAYAGSVLLLGLQTPHKLAVVGWYAGGVATWTLLEYFVHRFVLHGRFPSGPT